MMEKESKTSQSNLNYLRKYFKPYSGAIILTLITLVISRLAVTLDPIYLKQIIDFITSRAGQGNTISGSLLSILIIYLGLRVVSFTFEFLRDYFFAPVEMDIGRNIASDLFDKLLALPISYHHDQKTGTLARRISRGAMSINFILDFLVINILPTIVELVFVTVLLIRFYPASYGIITLLTVISYAAFTVWTTEFRQKYRLAANVADDEASAVQVETIYNIETIKYFGNQEFQHQKFIDRLKDWYTTSVRSNQLFGAISAGQSAVLLLGFGLIIFLAVKQALAQEITIGDLVLLTTYVVRLSVPISTLGFVYRRIKDGLTDISEMVKILRTEIALKESSRPITITRPTGKIKFEEVHFNYENRPALRGLSFDIPAGKKVAIVGPSGAGKSTIVKLLFRLHDPDSGRILLDDADLRELKREQLYQLMALVPQESILFNDTIGQNIRFGKPGANMEEIARAARLANLDNLIKRLPKGFETIVGERGVKLSGGEKQRVAIARAIIKDPKILVFDEATSNLDVESEQEILKSIDAVSKGRTTISIAHRLPTITNCDIIFVIDQGKLAESGTHSELLRKNGLYARLWQRFIK